MWDISINNIGGITSGRATIHPGLNVVQASNFQGKSSFMRALQTVWGTTTEFNETSLTAGRDEGHVRLERSDPDSESDADGPRLYETTVADVDDQGTLRVSGDTVLGDEKEAIVRARLFAFLDEDNPIRKAVRNHDYEELTSHLLRPLELENIQDEIEDLRRDRERIDERLDEIEEAKKKLTTKEQRIQAAKEDLKEKRAELENFEQTAAPVEEEEEDDELSELEDDVAEKRKRVNDLEDDLQDAKTELKNKRPKLEQKREELEQLEIPNEVELDTSISELEQRKRKLEYQIGVLDDLYRKNLNAINDEQIDLGLIGDEVSRQSLDEEFNCWVCGNETSKNEVEDRLKALASIEGDLREEKSEIEDKVDDVKDQQRRRQRKVNKRDELKREIADLEEGIETAEWKVDNWPTKIEEARKEHEELREELNEAKGERNQKHTDLKVDVSNAESNLEELIEERDELEEQIEGDQQLKEERDEIASKITALRQHRMNKQNELEDRFQTSIQAVVEEFAPGFEQVNLEGRKRSSNADYKDYSLNIVREDRSGDLTTLSEGELELVGIILAVAGYRTYNVGNYTNLILIDGVSQLAAQNLVKLTNYLLEETATEYLITTAYPEAEEEWEDWAKIDPMEWEVVSRRQATA